MTNLINKILLGQFRVDAFIASGGMGTVYRVWDLKRNVPLAMKTLHSDLADDPHIFKRFKREANALKKLIHPHIVQYYGLFTSQQFSFLLESYIDGPSMKDILKERRVKPMSIQEALTYIKAISSALGYAHTNGVVHCDVKPANILADSVGNLYLTDFGIARHAESTATTLGTIGTAAYMAPEQIRGETVTPATDIYALGVMLFEMLTGKRPFRGSEAGTEKGGDTSNERIRYAHLHLQPPNPQSLNPSISKELVQVILKALDKKSSRRYQTIQEFFEAVCAASGTISAHIPDRIILPASLKVSPSLTPVPHAPHIFLVSASRKLTIPLLIGSIALIIFIVARGTIEDGTQTGNHGIVPSAPPIRQIPASPSQIVAVTPSQTSPPSPASSSVAELSCPGAPHPDRFKVDQLIIVCTQRDTLALRASPEGDILVRLIPGSSLTITGGPSCEGSVYWWKVRTESGKTGWVMDGTDDHDEYFICPVE